MRAGLRTVRVLVLRDLRIFLRERSRVFGALAQPLLFWLLLGAGLTPSFRMVGTEDGPSYFTFFYPGVVLMMLLFVGISSTMSVIEDRHRGFLRGVMAAPGPRWSLVSGKILGGTVVALLHAVLFLALAPAAGFPLGDVRFDVVALSLVLSSVALNAVCFLLAWRIDSTSGYHVVMMVVLLPLWALSGALFPVDSTQPVLFWAARLNPIAYGVSSLRAGLSGGGIADCGTDLLVLLGCAAILSLAAVRFSGRGS